MLRQPVSVRLLEEACIHGWLWSKSLAVPSHVRHRVIPPQLLSREARSYWSRDNTQSCEWLEGFRPSSATQWRPKSWYQHSHREDPRKLGWLRPGHWDHWSELRPENDLWWYCRLIPPSTNSLYYCKGSIAFNDSRQDLEERCFSFTLKILEHSIRLHEHRSR